MKNPIKINSVARRNALKNSLQIVTLSGFLLFLSGCAAHYVAYVPVGPVEVVPVAPYAGAVWIGGSWAWQGGRHVWAPGYYSRPRIGRTYVAGEWRHGPRGHYYVRGGWR
jgi:hypothetical protein